MDTFWSNLNKFPRFLISVLIGFFLTTFQPIFELLQERNKRFISIMVLCLCFSILYKTLKLMLALN
uniref:Uncharacterized protein ycf33 n=1 Tax=Inkyuleea mariana TaxID=123988 RepID=A0A4D6X2U7_9FLOR|nr:hypothetical protein [Inkyuleea mariana]